MIDLTNKTELTIEECQEIIENSSGGSLDLCGCTSLTSLPDNLIVGGWLGLGGCTSLTSLPDNLIVGGRLSLYGCTSLTSLPDNLIVNEDLVLRGCTSLTSLPDNLTVGGSLSLYGCTSLTSLPDNLTVGGWLNLGDCTSLTSLPDNLIVGGWLGLRGCTSLTSLPDNLIVGGWLILEGCPIKDTSSVKKPHNGDYVEGRYIYADGILAHVKSKRTVGKYTIYYGKIKGRNVVYDGVYYAHCKTIRDGIKDIEFKHARDKEFDDYKSLTLDSAVSKDDAIVMYRNITGACQQGYSDVH